MGPVTRPAYESTTAEFRSEKEEYETLTAGLRTQDNVDEIAEAQRTLALRSKKLELQAKIYREGETI